MLDRRRGEAARRHSGHGRGFALDERRRGARRARRRSRPRRRRHQRRQASVLGRRRRSAVDNPQDARRRLFKVDAATARRLRSAPPTSASGSSTCSATTPPSRLSPTIRASAAGITPVSRSRLRDARRHGPASIGLAAAVARGVAVRQARRLSRRLVERPRPGRERDPHPRSRDRQGRRRSAPPKPSDVTTFRGATRRASGSPAGRSLGAIYGVVRTRRNSRLVALRRRHRSARTVSPPQISPAPDKTGFAAVRETAGEPPEIVFKARADADWKPVTTLNGAVAGGLQRLPRGARRCVGRARDGLELDGLVLLPRDRKPGPLPTIVDIHGGPSWAAKYAFNPGLRAAVRRRRLCGLPAELPRQHRLGPEIRAAQYRRSGRR